MTTGLGGSLSRRQRGRASRPTARSRGGGGPAVERDVHDRQVHDDRRARLDLRHGRLRDDRRTASHRRLEDIAIQPDGKIVAVGRANNDFGVVRFTSGGVLDTTFDGDGIVMTDFGTASDKAAAVALQGDGKLVVAGTGNDRFAVARYTTAGVLDATFDGDGKVTTTILGQGTPSAPQTSRSSPTARLSRSGRAFDEPRLRVRDRPIRHRRLAQRPDDHGLRGSGRRRAHGVAIQGDGRIVVVGGAQSCSSDSCAWTLARYTSVTPIRTLAASPSSSSTSGR